MNTLKKLAALFLIYVGMSSSAYCLENVFYVLRTNASSKISTMQDSVNSIQKNASRIHMIISQAYQVDQTGKVWGFVDPAVQQFADSKHIKFIAMITNVGFNTQKAHLFLSNPKAQAKAIQTLLDECDKHHYAGVQFDFEMIALEDRDELTRFYQTAADALHKKGLIVSYAVAPLLGGANQDSEFQRRLYKVWQGAYDLKALGKSADFVTIMTYNQHAEGTTPGSTAGIRWVEAAIKYALTQMPAHKISLGIPAYSNYWYAGATSPTSRFTTHMSDMSYKKVTEILKKHHAHLKWDPVNKVDYAIFERDWLNEYLFVENAKSFKAKLALAKKYHLRGISVFYIGIEDPGIWKVLHQK